MIGFKVKALQNKHAVYYRKPTRFLNPEDLQEITFYKSRIKNLPGDKLFETPRADFIKKFIDYKNKTILDIGCSTGFFLFDALDHGAKNVICYEGSIESYSELVNFVEKSGLDIEHNNRYYNFDAEELRQSDVVHLLNVVHHFGEDYGADVNVNAAKAMMIQNIDALAKTSREMVFQMGFNWKGDVKYPLFPHGEKRDVIEFLEENLKFWSIQDVGVAVLHDECVEYEKANDLNMKRNEDLGEFLNRPLIILKSKVLS